MKVSIPLICLSLLLLLASCENGIFCSDDEKSGLPPITTEGKGTFGCLVDGKLFLPYGTGTSAYGSNPDMSYTELSGTFKLGMGRSDTKTYMILRSFLNKTGVHGMLSTSSILLPDKNCAYWLDRSLPNQLEILHLDKEADIISGTFEGVFTTDDCYGVPDTIRVAEGRFDLRYTL